MIDPILTVTPDQVAWTAVLLLALGAVSPRAAFFLAALVVLFYALGRIVLI